MQAAKPRKGLCVLNQVLILTKWWLKKKITTKLLETFQGYKIQIYYGSEKECYEIKDEFSSLFPDIATSIIFSTPQWKLQVGNYRTRLEADHEMVNIKKEYPAAIVLATEIEIK